MRAVARLETTTRLFLFENIVFYAYVTNVIATSEKSTPL